ncbi:hypothetical protein [Prolixibacter bellariivorans]|nr:hypothetical protein [Prolixibacter bellariivorans]
MKRELLFVSVFLLMLPWGVRAKDWGWSVGGGYSHLNYSHERQSSPAGFYGSSFYPKFNLFLTSERRENIFQFAMWNFNNWKYNDSNESAPEQKMMKLMVAWEQHRYLTKKQNSMFRLYVGPEAGISYRKWNLNYDGGTDLMYHWTNVGGGIVVGSMVNIVPGIGLDVQANAKGTVGFYSSTPQYYANSSGVESGFDLGLTAQAYFNLNDRVQICPQWSYLYGRDYNKRYSLMLWEQRWSVSIKFMPFHEK